MRSDIISLCDDMDRMIATAVQIRDALAASHHQAFTVRVPASLEYWERPDPSSEHHFPRCPLPDAACPLAIDVGGVRMALPG
jgi:hypothetical protein